MRLNLSKATGLLVLAGLLMPAGMLLASETPAAPAVTSSSANWYNVEEASNLFNEMNNLALRVRREVGRLQVQGYQLGWREQSSRLAGAKYDVDTLGSDLMRLSEMKGRLEPWQQSLLTRVTPQVHEMVYQMDAAINRLNKYESRDHLALTQYPQNINQIYRNANQMADTIGTVTQYAHAEEKMAALKKMDGSKAGS